MNDIQVKFPADQAFSFKLGAKHRSLGLSEGDNPYSMNKSCRDLSMAWQSGFNYFGAMDTYSKRMVSLLAPG